MSYSIDAVQLFFAVGRLDYWSLCSLPSFNLTSIIEPRLLPSDSTHTMSTITIKAEPEKETVADNASVLTEATQQVVPQELLQAIRDGECILFIGAGLSREAGYPDGFELARKLRSEITDPRFQPDEDAPLSEVAQKFEASRSFTRADLVSAIKRALTLPRDASPDKRTLKLIANIPYLNKRIITTNWDSLIEDTIREEMEVPPAIVIQDTGYWQSGGRSEYCLQDTWLPGQSGDNSRYGSRLSTHLSTASRSKSLLIAHIRTLLTSNRVIYVGYSLQDEDFEELLLNQIQSALQTQTGYLGSQHYALVPRFDMPGNEYRKKQKAWSKKHVNVIDCEARRFFEEVYQQTSEFKNRERQNQPFVRISESLY